MRARGWSDRGQGRARHLSIYNWFLAIHQPALPASYLPQVIDAEVFTNCKTNYKINYRIRSQYRYVRKQPRSSIQIFAAVIIKKSCTLDDTFVSDKKSRHIGRHDKSSIIIDDRDDDNVMMLMSMTTMMMMDFGERSDQISHLAIDFLPPTAAVLQLQEGITITTMMMMMMTITITRTMMMTMRMTMINFGERRRREEGGDTMHLLLIRSALLWKC